MKCYERLVDPELISYSFELWLEQIRHAFVASHIEGQPPLMDNIVHMVSLPWKFLFAALTPPPVLFGGWLLFIWCLFLIGLLTAFIADLAETFGCCLGFENTVTAILVVAPGTSLPDLF